MRGATPGISGFNVPSIPIRSRKSRRLSEVSNRSDAEVTADPSATVIIQDSEDNTEGISLPTPIAQSLGVTPPAPLLVKSDSLAIPPCSAVQTAVDVSQSPLPCAPSLTLLARSASELSSESSLLKRRCTDERAALVSVDVRTGAELLLAHTDVDAARKELDRHKSGADTLEISAVANRQSADDYAAQVEMLKEEQQKLEEDVKKRDAHLEAASAEMAKLRATQEKSRLTEDRLRKEQQKLEEDVKKRDAHLEAASAEMAKLRATLEKSHLTEDRLRKERDEARRRADEISNGSSSQSARHSSRLERRMVEDEYQLPPGLIENYMKEEKEYHAQVESSSVDSLGDDTLFPTPPPPPPAPPRDVASQVPEGISEHGSFLLSQDEQDGDQT
ncbi:hypothetical protein AALP_AAs51418U000300 [Arabis alpina]|nr:hypothetical protein AALP_AAs51418U000300 [Arabis alpina]